MTRVARGSWTLLLSCTLALLMLAGGTATAFQEDSETGRLNIPLPVDRETRSYATVTTADGLAPSAVAFETRAGARWSYWWNDATGTPRQAWGPAAETGFTTISTKDEAEAVARGFVRDNAGLFGTAGDDLVLRSANHGMGKWGVVFDQQIRGVPVVGGRAHVLMTDSGRITNLGSTLYPGIDISLVPSMGDLEALKEAKRSIGFAEGRDAVVDGGTLVIVPDTSAGGVTYSLAWVNRLEVAEPFGIWRTTVDANTGKVLGRWNEIQFLNYFGESRGDVENYGYCDGVSDLPFPNQRVNITGVGTVYTDENGEFFTASPETDPKPISAGLDGHWLNVNNQSGADAQINGVITPGTPFSFYWHDGNSQSDERDVYVHGTGTHDFITGIDPDLTAANYEMPAKVSINASCNAYWDGVGINFFREAGGCANTGRIGDIIIHEYGHGVTQWVYGSNSCDTGESGSDIIAMIMTGDPDLGEGFFLGDCETFGRTCLNELQWPDDYDPGSCHSNGQILCGFWYDAGQELASEMTEEELKDFLGNLWHFSRKNLLPETFPEQVLAAFITDDDDGDLSNGTPHYDALCVGATNHGFECPEIDISSTDESGTSLAFRLHQATPNPLGPATVLRFEIPERVHVELRIYSVDGRMVRSLVDEPVDAGRHHIGWDTTDSEGRSVSAGVYYTVLDAGGFQAARQIVVLR